MASSEAQIHFSLLIHPSSLFCSTNSSNRNYRSKGSAIKLTYGLPKPAERTLTFISHNMEVDMSSNKLSSPLLTRIFQTLWKSSRTPFNISLVYRIHLHTGTSYQATRSTSSRSGEATSNLIILLYSSGTGAPACTHSSTTAGALP